MGIADTIKPDIIQALEQLYDLSLSNDDLTINTTKPEFEGDYTLVLFGFVKTLKKSPEQLGNEIGTKLLENNPQLFSR